MKQKVLLGSSGGKKNLLKGSKWGEKKRLVITTKTKQKNPQ